MNDAVKSLIDNGEPLCPKGHDNANMKTILLMVKQTG